MTKSTITREESVQAVFDLKVGYRLGFADIEILKRVARMALAEKASEPVILYRERNPYNGLTTGWQELTENEFSFLKENAGENAEFLTLYRHAQPAPVVPDAYVRDERGRMMLNGVCEPKIGFGIGWNACRAAMLDRQLVDHVDEESLTSINPAPTLVSLPKNAKSLTGNSPVIGIDLASGPDRTVEVHYVVPPGYVVVPKEPTDEMIAAAMNCEDVLFNSDDSFCVQFVNIYEAMLAAAPKEVK